MPFFKHLNRLIILPIAGALSLSLVFLVVYLVFFIDSDQQRAEDLARQEQGDQDVVEAGNSFQDQGFQQAFLGEGLSTNTARHSVGLSEIVRGGSGKDTLPALTGPKFVSLDEVSVNLTDETMGIFLNINEDKRFYPYNVLIWHEVVNDVVGGESRLITFCPLCGSALVFDPQVNGQQLTFGVSGKLYESNLLMYDTETESLWSQALGEAIVGERLGDTLRVVPFQLLPFAQVKSAHPGVKVLSEDTGYDPDYSFYPYGIYDESDDPFFDKVSIGGEFFPSRTMFYVVELPGASAAFHLQDLSEVGIATVVLPGGQTLTATYDGGEITSRMDENGEEVKGFYKMWFLWAMLHQTDGVVWSR